MFQDSMTEKRLTQPGPIEAQTLHIWRGGV